MENALARSSTRRCKRTEPGTVWAARQDAHEIGGKRSRIESRFPDNKSGSGNKQRLPCLRAGRAFSFPDERGRASVFRAISLHGDISLVGNLNGRDTYRGAAHVFTRSGSTERRAYSQTGFAPIRSVPSAPVTAPSTSTTTAVAPGTAVGPIAASRSG